MDKCPRVVPVTFYYLCTVTMLFHFCLVFFFFGCFSGIFSTQTNDCWIHSPIFSGFCLHCSGRATYSFMALPGIGENSEAPSSSNSRRRSCSGSLTKIWLPNNPANIFPLIKLARLPNIGLMLMRGSTGIIEEKNSLDSSSGRGNDI